MLAADFIASDGNAKRTIEETGQPGYQISRKIVLKNP
jgi:hypothetical protein